MTRGIRNNNPGNMEPGGWNGEIGTDGRFARFVSMQKGIRALGKQLLVYQSRYGLNTIREAIERWAPPNENHTDGYVAFVAHILEVEPDDKLDFSDRSTLWWMAVAIMEQENGHAAVSEYIADADINAGIDEALA
jgi:hypothetical protein